MSNLFKQNMNQDHVKALAQMKVNIAFAQRLTRDLNEAFDVVVRHEHELEKEFSIIVYEPGQRDRYGWGFTFKATPSGLEFHDGRGIWLTNMAAILGVNITADDYLKRDEDLETLRAKAAKIEVEVIRAQDTACGDHFTLRMQLSETDKHLDAKIKLIIATMQTQSVKTRLENIK
jgi:hypothetical protein